MLYHCEIKIKATDPVALASDFEAVTRLLEERNAKRRAAERATPTDAVNTAERIAREGGRAA
jgi:hypothetical protein